MGGHDRMRQEGEKGKSNSGSEFDRRGTNEYAIHTESCFSTSPKYDQRLVCCKHRVTVTATERLTLKSLASV